MTLIDTADIAAMICLQRQYVRDEVVKRPDFPAPALRLSRKTVRWELADVQAWIRAQQIRAGRLPAPPSRGSTSTVD